MALVLADRVRDTTATTGTGTVTLSGTAPTGYQNFSVIGNANTTYYTINSDTQWEVGVGTYTSSGTTLARNTVLASSNGGALVDFAAGTKDVFVTYPSEKAVTEDYGNALAATTAANLAGGAAGSIPYQTAANTTSLLAAGTGVLIGGATPSYTMSPSLTQVTVAGDPSTALQVATKQYVDTQTSAGIHYHEPVRVESPLNLNATYNNGTAGVGATLTNAGTQAALVIDGVTVIVADRVLIYQQTNSVQNGIYVVTNVGSGSTNWVLTRSSDADTYVNASPDGLSEGSTVFVQQGTTGAGTTYTCNTTGTITFGTTAITFVEISSAQIYSAGTGLTLTGTTFSLTAPVATSLGGTGLTTFTSGGAVYATSASVLTTGTLPATAGGTGQSSYTTGDLLYAASATTIGVIADVATGNALISGGAGGDPSYGKIGLTTHISGTLAVGNGGTGATTLTGYLVGNGTSAFTTTATIPTSDLSGTISLTTQVSGTLGAGNGGTGISSYTVGDILYASGTTTLSSLADVATGNALISGGVSNAPLWGKIGLTTHVSGTLPVANGGSGATTLTGYLKGNGTSAFTASATIPSGDITGAALTKADDTNVTLTLGGSPSTALLAATSITAGWSGQLAVSRGGTGNSTLASGYLLKGNGVSPTSASVIYDSGTSIGINTSSPSEEIEAFGVDASIIVHNSGQSRGGISALSGGRIALTTTTSGDDLVFGYAGSPITSAGFVPRMTIDNGTGSITAGVDFRAPIFYDSDNTAWYVDPAGASYLSSVYTDTVNSAVVGDPLELCYVRGNEVRIGPGGGNLPIIAGEYTRYAAGTGFLSGRYGSVETNGTTGPIYCISTSYAPTSTTLGSMYGIGYTDGASSSVWAGGGWGMYVAAAGVVRVFLDGVSGIGHATGSFRAPIFYDSANTAYYIDPNSTSRIVRLVLDNGDNLSWGGVYGAGVPTIAGSTSNGIYFYPTGSTAGATFTMFSSYAIATGSMRAPLFYDSDNTAFFVDPNSTSVLSVVRANTLQFSSGNQAADLNNGSYFILRDPTANAAIYLGGADPANYYDNTTHWFRTRGGSNMAVMNSNGIQAPIFYDISNTAYYGDFASTSVVNTVQYGINYTSGGGGGRIIPSTGSPYSLRQEFGSDNSGWRYGIAKNVGGTVTIQFYVEDSGTVAATGDFRAPIFYDSNDTNYYLDPNSSSVLNTLYFRNSSGANVLVGNASNFGYSSSYRTLLLGNQAYTTVCIGVDPVANASGSFNGAGSGVEVMFKNGVNFITPNSANNSYLTPLTLADGYAASTGSFRAPVFYDSNNTAYYVDPASGTVLGGNVSVLGGRNIGIDTSGGSITIKGDSGGWGTGLYFLGSAGTNRGGFGALGGGDGLSYLWAGNAYNNAALYLYAANYAESPGSFRAPIFYDSNNTGYYLDAASTSNLNAIIINGQSTMATQNALVASDYGHGVYGVYSAEKYQHVWSMGTSYSLPANGLSTGLGGNLYGLAWSYNPGYGAPGNNAQSKDGLNHQLLLMMNGTTYFAAGNGVWTSGIGTSTSDWRAPIFYDSGNTAYYVNPDGTSNIYQLTGAITYGSYGSFTASGSLNSYAGISFPAVSAALMMNQGSSGFYFNNNTWGMYCNNAGSVYAALYYDISNTAYYVDPASTTNLNVLTTAGAITATGNVTAYSDIRVKANVETIPSALHKLDQIRGVTYTRTDLEDKERRYAGVIAQEIEQVLPEAIFENEEYKSVDYNATIGLLIQAVKELTDKVKALEAKEQ